MGPSQHRKDVPFMTRVLLGAVSPRNNPNFDDISCFHFTKLKISYVLMYSAPHLQECLMNLITYTVFEPILQCSPRYTATHLVIFSFACISVFLCAATAENSAGRILFLGLSVHSECVCESVHPDNLVSTASRKQ